MEGIPKVLGGENKDMFGMSVLQRLQRAGCMVLMLPNYIKAVYFTTRHGDYGGRHLKTLLLGFTLEYWSTWEYGTSIRSVFLCAILGEAIRWHDGNGYNHFG